MPFTIKDERRAGLCGSCSHVQMITGDRLADLTIFCHWPHPALRITHAVRTCTAYQERNRPDKDDMERIGWVLEVNGGRVMGFRPPKRKDNE